MTVSQGILRGLELRLLSVSGQGGRRLLGTACAVLLCASLAPAAASQAAAAPEPGPAAADTAGKREELGNYDSRRAGAARGALTARKSTLAARPSKGLKALRAKLGIQGIVDIDPLTATPRRVARVDGFLTKASKRSPAAIALGYVKAHPDVFGLDAAAVAKLKLRKDYVDIAGIHHLSFVQSVGGVPVFGNGLKAHVTKNGRLIQVDGSPVAKLPGSVGAAKLTAAQARAAAVADVFGTSKAEVKSKGKGPAGRTTFTGGDVAQQVVFQTLDGARLAWQTISMTEGYLHVLDAQSGRVLFRQNLVHKDTGLAWTNYPGAPVGGVQQRRDLTVDGWLPRNSPRLAGNVAHVYTDVNADNVANPSEEVRPSSPGRFEFRFRDFTAEVGAPCSAQFQCSWNPKVPGSWRANREQDATQLFFYLGNFHDHLERAPIGFTRSAGNFEAVDDDAVQGEALDGANLAGGLPDSSHTNNANMATPPDGMKPRMQMFLFRDPADPEDPFIAGNSGDTADVVYHEYTHGLSNRLVVDANGVSTLGNLQAGSMGEAWSDFYAMDLLVATGQETDTAAPGEVLVAKALAAGGTFRTEGLDCPVSSTDPACAGTPGAGPGGYTYGDYAQVINRPEVHADGEIWAQTLWDLRKALGVRLTRSLVTRAMELSPANPSFLDMRNAILIADLVVNEAKKQKAIWKVFAQRGMGFFAGSVDGDDAAPVEDFSMPPPAGTPRGSLTGTVTDVTTGAPIADATVAFGGHNSGFGDDLATTTGPTGVYTITGIIPGTYPKVFARGAGYDPVTRTVSVASRSNVVNWALRRDWAALGGGSAVVAANGEDFSDFGCGPAAMFDQSQGSGWSTDAVFGAGGAMDPRFVVVRLPVAVNVAEITIDPSGTCGDGASASTGDFRVETSPDGTTWTVASSGHFGIANRNKMNSVPLAAGSTGAVRFVRYTMLSTQVAEAGGVCPGPFSGCDFVDSVELAVYGLPSA
jgi:extracellular elastinolytic metalloproteinase